MKIQKERERKKAFMKSLLETLTDHVLDDIGEGYYDDSDDHFESLKLTLENFIEDFQDGSIKIKEQQNETE